MLSIGLTQIAVLNFVLKNNVSQKSVKKTVKIKFYLIIGLPNEFGTG